MNDFAEAVRTTDRVRNRNKVQRGNMTPTCPRSPRACKQKGCEWQSTTCVQESERAGAGTVGGDGSSPQNSVRQTKCGDEARSEEHTSELQSHHDLVCRLLLE